MKTENVTYEKFLAVVQKMAAGGEKLTIRGVHSHLGGSFGKVSDFLKRYGQERANVSQAQQSNISDSLRQAILSEVGRAVGEAKLALESQLQQATEHLQEANEKLAEQEKTIKAQSQAIDALKEQAVQSQQIIKGYEAASQDLKKALESVEREKSSALSDAAKSKQLFERADHDISELKENLKELQKRIDSLTSEKYEAQKRAAVSEAKFEQISLGQVKR